MERRKYKNPPIEEAICEFHFVPGPEWDFAFHIRFLEKFRPEYPGKVRRMHMMQAGFQAGFQEAEQQLTMKQGESRVQYPTAEGTRIVAVGLNILGIHVLRPYEGWEAFAERIERAMSVYREVAQPQGVKRVVLRYINRIQFPFDKVKLGEFFAAAPTLPEVGYPVVLRSILSRVDSVYEDLPARLALTFASVEAPAGQAAFLLDIEVGQEWEPKIALPLDEAIPAAHNLKVRLSSAFEAMITDKLRETFDDANG
jgi:uncharacterized protein (TIGR04255 family)